MTSTRAIQTRGRTLRQYAARGAMVNAVFLTGLSVLSLVRGFVLAAFLTASDYGVWGILIVSLGMLLWLKQIGIGDKYIQQDEADQELAFQKAFTLEAMFTGIFMVLLAVAVPVVALIYGHDELVPAGFVLILVLPANVLQTPFWVYARNLDFGRQRQLQAVEPIVGFIVAVGVAAAGGGYWALAAGVIAGAYSSAALAVVYSPYKLRFRYDRGTLHSYATFSWPLFIANGSSMVMVQVAVIVCNAKVGLAATGALALSNNITAFTERVDNLVTGTLYPAICAMKDHLALLEESFVKSNQLALIWALPFGTAVTLFADSLVHYVIGDKWAAAIPLLHVMGVVAAVGQIAFNWDAYMRALGRTRPMAVAGAVTLVSFLVAGVPLIYAYGLKGVAYGLAVQMVAHVSCRAYFLNRLFDGFGFLAHALRAATPTVIATAVLLGTRALEDAPSTPASAVVELTLYGALIVGGTWLLERRLLREALSYVLARRSD